MRRARAALLLMLFLFAIALAQPQLTVSTDSPVYEPGSTLTILIRGPPWAVVGLEVRGPAGELVALRQLQLDARGEAKLKLGLSPLCSEGEYTIYTATPGALAKTTFIVLLRPLPLILLAPPGQVRVGEGVRILGFVYPGLPLEVTVYVRPPGGDWELAGRVSANSSGWFAVPYRPAREGLHLVRVEYGGSTEYAPTSATANFTAVKSPPAWRVTAPQLAWLGDEVKIECEDCEYVVARTVASERVLKRGERVKLDVPGPWALYPARGRELGNPTILLVRARVFARVEGPVEAGVNEPIQLRAQLSLPVPALRVYFESRGRALGTAVSRGNGTAIFRIALAEVGDYLIVAKPESTSVFEPVPGQPLSLRVLGERVFMQFEVVDAKGRRLYNAVVEVGGTRLEAPMGVAKEAFRAGEYEVRVRWRGLLVYSGRLKLVGGNVTLTAHLYDLEVHVVDFLNRPAAGVAVELYNGTALLAVAATDKLGRVLFIRLPPGSYAVKADGAEALVTIPRDSVVTVKLPLPPWLLLAVAAIAAAVLAAIALKKGGIRLRIQAQKESSSGFTPSRCEDCSTRRPL